MAPTELTIATALGMPFIRAVTAAVAISVSLGGCTEMNRLSPSATVSSGNDSIFVLGLAPSNHRILIFSGSIEDGLWHQNPWAAATFMGTAKDGYVLARASAGATYAIASIVVLDDEKKRAGRAYISCGNAQTLVFTVPAGKVVYLTDLNFGHDGARLKLNYSNELGKAAQYVDQHFPGLKGHTEAGSFELRKTDTNCSGDPGAHPDLRAAASLGRTVRQSTTSGVAARNADPGAT